VDRSARLRKATNFWGCQEWNYGSSDIQLLALFYAKVSQLHSIDFVKYELNFQWAGT
jgi:hypothetical protein